MTKPLNATVAIQEAVDALLRLNCYTHGRKVKDMYLGPSLLVIRLVEPVTIEGQWQEVERSQSEIDIFDLMNAFQGGAR